jgi:diguanylate cyclase (GGDEF)-like protein
MNDNLPTDYNQIRWNRLLLFAYWFVLLLSIAVEFVYLKMGQQDAGRFIRLFMVRPSLLLAAVILLAEAGVRFLPRHHDYILISASTLIAVVLIVFNPNETYLLFAFFFPIMVSTFYFQLQKLFYAFANSSISFTALCLFDQDLLHAVTPGSIAGFVSMFVLFSAVAAGVLLRGRELTAHLSASFEANRELLVRTIRMDRLSKTDALTDTYNHMAFHEFLDRLVEQGDLNGTGLHLALLDIDRFKSVNDTYGHQAGDNVIRRIGSIVRSKIGAHDVAARYGGEEFALLFIDQTFQEAFDRIEEIRQSVEGLPHEALLMQSVTVSAGLATYTSGQGKEAFFRQAEWALGEAKRQGRNRTVFASADKQERSGSA